MSLADTSGFARLLWVAAFITTACVSCDERKQESDPAAPIAELGVLELTFLDESGKEPTPVRVQIDDANRQA